MSHTKLHSDCYLCRFQKVLDRGGRRRLCRLGVTWLQHYLFICIDIFPILSGKEGNLFLGSLYLFIKRCNFSRKIELTRRNPSRKLSYSKVTRNFE